MGKESKARSFAGISIKLNLLPEEKALIDKAARKSGQAAFVGTWARETLLKQAAKVLG